MALTQFYADSGSVEIDGTEYKSEVLEISIGGGDRDFTTVFTFGDSFEDHDRQSAFETTITVLKQDTDLAAYVLGGSPLDTEWPITYSGDTTNRYTPTIKYSFYEDDTGIGSALRIVFSGAFGIGISKSIDAEGYLSEEVTFKCLAKNYSEQWTPDTVASGLE